MNKLSPLFLLLVVFTSCTSKYEIKGCSSLSRLDGRMLYMKALTDGKWTTVDSAEVIHGSFCMKGEVDSVMMVNLYLDEENLMPLVLEKGKVKIIINTAELKATGTPLNDAFYGLTRKSWGGYANNLVSLNKKNFISETPLSCALKALILALNDSANAFVDRLTKKFNISS